MLSSPDVDDVDSVTPSWAPSETTMPAATLPDDLGVSPFVLQAQDVELLAQSDGFRILRDHLAQVYTYELCEEHGSPAHQENFGQLILVRDVLHALLVPVVELFDKAVALSTAATHATKVEELEYAFSGPARSAFVWLQCFLAGSQEREWCFTRGCAGCVLAHTLDSEFSVRLLVAACLLSDVHYPFTLDGPTLPSFMFFLGPLERALAADPLYGADFFDRVQPKAVVTRNAIEDLIHQCVEMELVLSQPSSPSDAGSPASSNHVSPLLGPLGPARGHGGFPTGMKVKRSKIARRQMSLQIEEERWVEEMLKRCWEQLQPAVEAGLLAQHLDAIVPAKPEVMVSVEEVAS